MFDHIDARTGEVHYRNDIVEQQKKHWVQACPSTEGGHNWQAMSYHPGTNELIIPLSQSCMEMSGRDVDPKEGSGGTSGGPSIFRDARHERQCGQAGGVRRDDDEGEAGRFSSARRF